MAGHILNTITDSNIGNASLKDKVLCAAILTGKVMQMGFDLAAGEPVRTVQVEAGAFTQSEQENHDNHS
ncbi:MAG: hypothetical protein M0Z52_04305 [Actinomycetota bacterium]|nr:hypothetical protein [Actinomycetota bacterium]